VQVNSGDQKAFWLSQEVCALFLVALNELEKSLKFCAELFLQ
jgi:hypothetical protein